SDENTVNSVIIPRGISSDQLTLDDIENLKKDVEEGFNRIHLLTDLEKSVENCDLLIEAVSENPEQKSDFYKNLAKVLNDNTIVATNSSTLLPSSFKDLLPIQKNILLFTLQMKFGTIIQQKLWDTAKLPMKHTMK
ncbi:MAG: 3-hydroxyacyl-CoA dehydrogenase NAD-binding domain-containing protein, partial [Finegoldia magna]|nr:3-hydroxyacyl-CoA dehydrogenase NAD-binding domain-containing protein [Finegoldia magna]